MKRNGTQGIGKSADLPRPLRIWDTTGGPSQASDRHSDPTHFPAGWQTRIRPGRVG